jgi:F-type H+-transporting ATPase subunit b
MRRLVISASLLVAPLATAIAQEAQHAEAGGGGGLMSLQVNLMFWTLLIFGALFLILKKWGFPAILGMVEAREKALEEAIEGAKRDREAAARLLAEHQAKIDAARGEAQKLIADSRAVSEKMRQDLLDQTRREQQDMLERAKRDIEGEKNKAIAQLRKEAVELALAGASKVIEENLDSAKNRQLVETYLGSLGTLTVSRR